jgi:hypothetical protein
MKFFIFSLLILAGLNTKAQKDSLFVTKTETHSTASYSFSSTFNTKKTSEVKGFLEKRIGSYKRVGLNKYLWSNIGLPQDKNDIVSVKLGKGYIEMRWSNSADPSNTSLVLDKLKLLSVEITEIIK